MAVRAQRRGWFRTMLDDVTRLPGATNTLLTDEPLIVNLLNVKFDPLKVRFFEPYWIVPRDHKVRRVPRYHPIIRSWRAGFDPPAPRP